MRVTTEDELHADVARAGRIDAIPVMLGVICRVTRMRFAAVARVTEDRWIACQVRDEIGFGLKPGEELAIETTICNEIRQHGQPVIIDHVAEDAAFSDHPIPAKFGFQSYVSLPIVLPDGQFFGTLCALDPLPAKVSDDAVTGMFKLFAELVAFHFDAQRKIDQSAAMLVGERQNSDLREQFIAMLGHDLRNPLVAISASARVLASQPLDEQGQGVLTLMHGCIRRMTGLVDNVLDFARGRLGGGLMLERNANEPLEPTLSHIVDELRIAWPNRTIECSVEPVGAIECDRKRVGQLLSNLISNALTHGAARTPVKIYARAEGGQWVVDVSNTGEPIAAAVLEKLFHPFVRASSEPHGLGLGLYIASEIAKAHGGTLTARSSRNETRFTFRMPLSVEGRTRRVHQRAC